MDFQNFVQEIEKNNWAVHGAEVYEQGKLVHSWGDTAQTRYPVYSATKTITSLAAGMAADDGRLDLQRSVLDYLPSNAMREMGDQQRKVYAAITIKRLLNMAVGGYPFRPEGESWLKTSLQIAVDPEPVFHYSNISAYLVGVAVSCAVGEDLYQYLNRRLFVPLEIADPPCTRCPDGYFYGASGMALSVNEFSRIGLLLQNGGVYKGRRLISEAYIREATAVQIMNWEGGYGYFIWKYRNGFSINGKWGQKCYVLPDEKRLVTYLSNMEHGSGEVKACMEKYLLSTP